MLKLFDGTDTYSYEYKKVKNPKITIEINRVDEVSKQEPV